MVMIIAMSTSWVIGIYIRTQCMMMIRIDTAVFSKANIMVIRIETGTQCMMVIRIDTAEMLTFWAPRTDIGTQCMKVIRIDTLAQRMLVLLFGRFRLKLKRMN